MAMLIASVGRICGYVLFSSITKNARFVSLTLGLTLASTRSTSD